MPYTRLRYHLVIATSRRRPWLSPEVEKIVYPAFERTFDRLECGLIRAGGVEDHVHFVCAIPPKHAVSFVVGRLKSESARVLKNERTDCEKFGWGAEFGAFTLNPDDLGGIVSYVENQKEHHRTDDLRSHLERCDNTGT